MMSAFDFEEGGRMYTCRVEGPHPKRPQAWWWFDVSGDGHRYAPFQAASGDTQESVRSRIVAYYTEHITRRSLPGMARPHWTRRAQASAPTPQAPAPTSE